MVEIKVLINSFKYAIKGITFVFRNEQNFRIQVFISLIVVLAMIIFGIKRSEAIVVCLVIFLILILELLNSALEKFVDIIKPRLHIQAEVVKDIMAAMVFFASFGSVIIGIIIFWPYVAGLF